MPIQGFKIGMAVLTPSRRPATVVAVERRDGREWVTVRYDDGVNRRPFCFVASTLTVREGH